MVLDINVNGRCMHDAKLCNTSLRVRGDSLRVLHGSMEAKAAWTAWELPSEHRWHEECEYQPFLTLVSNWPFFTMINIKLLISNFLMINVKCNQLTLMRMPLILMSNIAQAHATNEEDALERTTKNISRGWEVRMCEETVAGSRSATNSGKCFIHSHFSYRFSRADQHYWANVFRENLRAWGWGHLVHNNYLPG